MKAWFLRLILFICVIPILGNDCGPEIECSKALVITKILPNGKMKRVVGLINIDLIGSKYCSGPKISANSSFHKCSEQEKEMLQSILTLNDTTVEEVLTHRKNIFSIDTELDLKQIIDGINKSKFTRIPFWENNPENIVGILDKRTLNIDFKNTLNNKSTILNHLKKPWFIPETTNLLDQLLEFKKRKEHLAFVVDEYGELLGLITLEDIIEEIVGEIVDEIDSPDEDFYINNKGTIITKGEKNLKDLYKHFNIPPPKSDSATIAGHIMDITKKIPLFGEIIKDKFFAYKILSHSRKQIFTVEISRID